jgi:hypothetical protein
MQVMHWLRVISWHALVVLVGASTLIAGTPQVRCHCNYLIQPAATSCCCCCAPADETDAPSCCEEANPASSDEDGPGASDQRCRKTVATPEAAAVERVEIKPVHPFTLVRIVVRVEPTAVVGALQRGHVPFGERPASDLQLLYQHFVI